MDKAGAKFWIGPSGWSYPDWYGTVYPKPKPRGFKPLAFLARHFNAVEVNSSFYAIPTPTMTASWPPQTPPDFRFAFKLTRIFTHVSDPIPDQAALNAYTQALSPVRAAGKLGPVLMQFPWSYRHTAAARERLRRLADGLGDYQRVIEVRHDSWAVPEALDFLQTVGGYCNIDQPRLRHCIGPTAHVFGGTAYVRLHGRNAEKWFAQNVASHERYNYLYSHEELREWIVRLNTIGRMATEAYVFTNNHYWGRAAANAVELKALLEDTKVPVPPQLLAAYPRLHQFALPPHQPGLFGPASSRDSSETTDRRQPADPRPSDLLSDSADSSDHPAR